MKGPATRLVMVTVLAAAFVGFPRSARAHCDTLSGPVVAAARLALQKGDVTPVLRWVRKEDEAEIRGAFAEALAVRRLGPAAQELADRSFFETLVRVHRASEGEPYTGLKPAGTDVGPAVAGADQALDTGSVDALVRMMTEHVAAGIRERFAHALETRQQADTSVEAGRRFVAAYVAYVHYVEGLHEAAAGAGAVHEGGLPAGAHAK